MAYRKTTERASRRQYHYIYKIIRDDGMFYIGRHSTNNLDDGYFGSGIRIVRSVEKYGRSRHTIAILEFLPSLADVKIREEQIVNEDILLDPMCLNLALGGGGGGRKGLVPVRTSCGTTRSVSQEEFYTNRHKYQATNEGMCAAINTETGKSLLIRTSDLDGVKFIHPCSGRVMVQTEGGHSFVSSKEFKTGQHHGVNFGMVDGAKNPQAKYIVIYDAEGLMKHQCRGNFEEVCSQNNLPFASLRSSYASGGKPIYQHQRSLTDAKRSGTERYIGWFATAISMKEQLMMEDNVSYS